MVGKKGTTALAVMIGTFTTCTLALNNGQGLVPPMGYNTWRAFNCNYNDTIIKKQAQLMVSLGLRDLGYVYMNVDDCWSL